MKLFSDCMDCCICRAGDGGCLAGIGDDDFYPATTEQIIERLRAGEYSHDKDKMIAELVRRGVTSPVKIKED